MIIKMMESAVREKTRRQESGGEGLRIYTDGGCTGNPGPGGWAAVILTPGKEPWEISGREEVTTNNRMELTAVIRALEAVDKNAGDGVPVKIISDSQYLQKGISQWMTGWMAKGWRTAAGKPVKNKDLWLQIKELDDRFDVEWTWVRGHSGNAWNERCDYLVACERKR